MTFIQEIQLPIQTLSIVANTRDNIYAHIGCTPTSCLKISCFQFSETFPSHFYQFSSIISLQISHDFQLSHFMIRTLAT
jgi:hypothetical protein